MSLRFLLGRAGAGKTRRCLAEIVAELRARPFDEAPLLLLVPEQATFQMERALLDHDERVAAITRARVVSFKRLAHLALERVGAAGRPFIGELGRLLALRTAIKRERESLQVYGDAASTDGFVERMAQIIRELKAHRQDPDSLARARERLEAEGAGDALLIAKLGDIERVYRRYEQLIRGRYQDGEDALSTAARLIEAGDFAAGAKVWIDGFAGFTPQEYALLGALLAKAEQVTFAACIDPGELPAAVSSWDEGPADALFHPTRKTLVAVRDLAWERGVLIEEAVRLGEGDGALPRFSRAPLLAAVEQALAESGGGLYPALRSASGAQGPQGVEGPQGAALTIIEASDRAGEVEAAAREIVRMVRDGGYRYSDIAVVARSLEPYYRLIEDTFLTWGIPHFLDQLGTAIHHPLVTLVESLLDMLVEGVKTHHVVRYLKTDLAPVTRDEADLLETHALRFGVQGAEWFDGALWGDLATVKERALAQVLRYLDAARSSGGVTAGPEEGEKTARLHAAPAVEHARALYELLEALETPAKLEAWADQAEREGDRALARDHRHVWDGLCRLIDEIAGVMGDAEITAAEFAAACQGGLARLRLGRVPAHADEVLVGSIDRSRQPELRCVIVLGWNEGVFPLTPAEDPILSDADRRRLAAAGVVLAPESRQRLFHERYLVYIALTRASERVIVSFSRADEAGRQLKASPVVMWLKNTFPGIPHSDAASTSPWELPERPGALQGWLARALRARREGHATHAGLDPKLRVVRRWISDRLDTSPAGPRPAGGIDPLSALSYTNASEPLPGDLVAAIYRVDPERGLSVSPSGLEDAAACPFKFFAIHGLGLAEREQPRMDAALAGTLLHAALRDAARRVRESGRAFSELAGEECDRLAFESIEALLARGEYAIFRNSAKGAYVARRLLFAVQATLRALADASRASAFIPVHLEAPFGPGNGLPPLAVSKGAYKGFIRGRIDRIDESEDGRYALVVDYKSSAHRLSLSEVFYGLDLQALIYLAVVANSGQGWKPAGCLYAPVVDPVASAERPEEEGGEWRKLLKPRGLVVDDGVAPRLLDSVSTGASPFAPLYFKKDGTLGSDSEAAAPDDVERLLEYVLDKAGDLVAQVLSGDTSIAPYEHGTARACSYCVHRPVCQFDPTAPPQGYRRLRPLRPDEVWERIAAEGGDARAG